MRAIYLFIALLLLEACNQTKLQKILQSEVIDLYKKDSLFYYDAVLTDTLGNELNYSVEFSKEVIYEFYMNENNKIVQVMEAPIQTFEDELLAIQMRYAQNFNVSPYLIPYNCDTLKNSLRNAGIRDQDIRNDKIDGDIEVIDNTNLNIVLTAIEQCGFPSMDQTGKMSIGAIWIILHHSAKEVMAYYFQDLQKAVYEGSLAYSQLALTIDRLLIYNGYQQVYATQPSKYKTRNPEKINQRLISVGMRPLDAWELEKRLGFDRVKSVD